MLKSGFDENGLSDPVLCSGATAFPRVHSVSRALLTCVSQFPAFMAMNVPGHARIFQALPPRKFLTALPHPSAAAGFLVCTGRRKTREHLERPGAGSLSTITVK